MASLTKSAVVKIDDWFGAGLNSRKFHYKLLTLTLTAQGTVANAIPASVLGLRRIYGCSALIKSTDDLVVVGTPSTNQLQLLLKAAATNAPADYTGVFNVIVWGKS